MRRRELRISLRTDIAANHVGVKTRGPRPLKGRQGGLKVSQCNFVFSGAAVRRTDLQGALCIKNLYSNKKKKKKGFYLFFGVDFM